MPVKGRVGRAPSRPLWGSSAGCSVGSPEGSGRGARWGVTD